MASKGEKKKRGGEGEAEVSSLRMKGRLREFFYFFCGEQEGILVNFLIQN